jgi:hypothetical protein
MTGLTGMTTLFQIQYIDRVDDGRSLHPQMGQSLQKTRSARSGRSVDLAYTSITRDCQRGHPGGSTWTLFRPIILCENIIVQP